MSQTRDSRYLITVLALLHIVLLVEKNVETKWKFVLAFVNKSEDKE